jgi:hypothetical protein
MPVAIKNSITQAFMGKEQDRYDDDIMIVKTDV